MLPQHHHEDLYVGARYRRREGSSIIWEVYQIDERKDGLPHVLLFNVADPTSRKTLSKFTLAQSGLYAHLPDG